MKKEISRHSIFTPNYRWIVLTVVLVVSFALFAGCAVTGKFAGMGIKYKRSHKQPHEIILIMEGSRPSRPYTIVGMVNTDTSAPEGSIQAPTTNEAFKGSFKAMRDTAARNGLDGVMDIHCAPTGTVGAGYCTGTGFVYK